MDAVRTHQASGQMAPRTKLSSVRMDEIMVFYQREIAIKCSHGALFQDEGARAPTMALMTGSLKKAE